MSGVLLILLFVMLLNLESMIFTGPILKFVRLPVLLVLGWVMQILMSALAVKVVLVALRNLRGLWNS